MSQRHGEAVEPVSFGVERELQYNGHLTPALQLVPLPKRTFASADETHIRVWSATGGDLAKLAFPSNRRSMVCSMAFCQTFSTLITGEMDMTMKLYSLERLELVESFALEQVRAKVKTDGAPRRVSGKVTSLACLSNGLSVLAGSECGCELWQLAKSQERRSANNRLRGFEHRLVMDLVRQVTTEPIHRIVIAGAEQRVIVCGVKSVQVFDLELNLTASCHMPHVCSVAIHHISGNQASMLTGATSGVVNFWSIQAFDAPDDEPGADGLCTRLEHAFIGHTRAVEMVCFYHRLEKDVRQRLAVSCSLDGKLQVWSLETFAKVYSLDLGILDSKAHIFSLAPHLFAASFTLAGSADGRQSAIVSIMRFTAHLATPFATTNGSPVVQIALPPTQEQLAKSSTFKNAAVLVSEDMAIRIHSMKTRQLISTLPPPPNSKVQVLDAFLCPIWQLLILWLSSEEVSIFFIPSPTTSKKDKTTNRNASTPLLLRRFGIVEVRTRQLDKDLSHEAFHSVSLYYGPLAEGDSMLNVVQREGTDGPQTARPSTQESTSSWFLLIGTKLGTLQAFKLHDLLGDLPIWPRLASHLSVATWKQAKRSTQHLETKAGAELQQPDARLQQIEKEHLEAMELSRAPGQRPFPRHATPVQLYGRWRRHDYPIEVVKSVANHIITIDAKQNLQICLAASCRVCFCFQLGDYSCLAPLLHMQAGEASQEARAVGLAGLASGTARGSLELVLLPESMMGPGPAALENTQEKPEVFYSHASHGGAVIQVDYLLSRDVFASVGRDDTVRLWSSRLVLLKEMSFPLLLTSVTFVQTSGDAKEAGDVLHGDLLVGFGAHVEQVPRDVWARGLPDEHGGGGPSSQVKSPLGPSPGTTAGTSFSNTVLQDEDMLLAKLHSWDLASQAGTAVGSVKSGGAASGALGRRTVVQQADRREASPVRVRNPGYVQDFRGPPLIPVGTLSSGAADMIGVEQRFAQSSIVVSEEHEHSQVLDQGDFRAITRSYPGYYDWTVNPSMMVDAPRDCAIRGMTGDSNVAVVTSVGMGHLRGGSSSRPPRPRPGVQAEEVAKDPEEALHDWMREEEIRRDEDAEEFMLPDRAQSRLSKASASKADKASPVGDAAEHSTDRRAATPTQSVAPRRPTVAPPTAAPPRRTFARASPAVQPGAADVKTTITKTARKSLLATAGVNESLGEVAAETEDADIEVEEEEFDEESALQKMQESWRNRRIARGVPLHADSPRQTLHNFPPIDQGLMLKERGRLTDAPEEQDYHNPLAKLGMKKTEFVYCGTDANLKAARRGAVSAVTSSVVPQDDDRGVITWTATGRLLTGMKMPPQKALPSSYMPQPPEHMRPRLPMTRSEVTEQRIMEAASKPPPGKEWMHELNITSEEYMVAEQKELRQQVAAKRQQRQRRKHQYGGGSGDYRSGSTTPASSMTPSNASASLELSQQMSSSFQEQVSREHPRGQRNAQVRR
eukprot:TRINITY_DN12372_c0_g1_i1.p1 TRINITY_DN12372_c0_g1~~TRINITY_DN12372_c0_g1_i1.p1  ORF type:complete len:1467 (-),score=297.42 TRINITY_DN12372_c0_g1_i1:54-4454(-)